MPKIVGLVKNATGEEPLSGVLAILLMGNSSNPADPSWAPYVYGSSPDAAPTVTTAAGAYSLSYTTNPTKPFVQLRFRGSDGTYWPVASANDVMIWPKETPPSTLTVLLGVPTSVQTTPSGGTSAQTGFLAGTVRGGTGAAAAALEVRLFGSVVVGGERLVGSAVTRGDGVFELGDFREYATYRALRFEFGPPEVPYEVATGTVTWTPDAVPSTFQYVVVLPATEAPASTGQNITLSGLVSTSEGTPLAGVVVGRATVRLRVLSVTLGAAESVLAGNPPTQIQPAPDGTYSALVAAAGGLNLQVTCEAEFSAGVWEEVARSVLFTKAPSTLIVNVVVDDDRLRIASDAGNMDVVDAALTAAGIADPNTVTARDEELLAVLTGQPRDKVRSRVAAKKLKKAIESIPGAPVISGHIYYALLSLRYPPRPRAFAQRTRDRSRDDAALREAVRRRLLVGTVLDEPALTTLLDQLTSLSTVYNKSFDLGDSLANLVRAASDTTHFTNAQIVDFVDRWYTRTSPAEFWADLATSPPSSWAKTTPAAPDDTIFAAKRAMDILWITEKQRATVIAFQTANPLAPASAAAEIGLSASGGWASLVASLSATDIPVGIVGATLADRRTAWADYVRRRALRRFPWEGLRGDVRRALTANPVVGTDDLAGVLTFLNTHRKTQWFAATPTEFHLGTQYLPADPIGWPTSLAPTPPAQVIGFLRALQRLYALIPREEAWTVLRVLWLAGFRSARDVSSIGLQRFLVRMETAESGAVDDTTARAVAARAAALATRGQRVAVEPPGAHGHAEQVHRADRRALRRHEAGRGHRGREAVHAGAVRL